MAETAPSRTDILLESGTNELEVLLFRIGGQAYGVNVAKVREVILSQPIAASPQRPPSVLGMFNLRNRILPLVDLHHYLDVQTDQPPARVIVTEFNQQQAAFAVDGVEQIHRISWKEIHSLPEVSKHHICVTGVTEIDDRLVLMLDFELIYDHIAMHESMHITHVENPDHIDRGQYRVVLVDDSNFIRNIMENVMRNSGYTQLKLYSNGLDAWNGLKNSEPPPDLIVSDIEMPQMDGLHLTRKIREHPKLSNVPVLLFSSLVTDATRHKSEAVGASEQIAKPDLPDMVKIADRLLTRSTKQKAA